MQGNRNSELQLNIQLDLNLRLRLSFEFLKLYRTQLRKILQILYPKAPQKLLRSSEENGAPGSIQPS